MPCITAIHQQPADRAREAGIPEARRKRHHYHEIFSLPLSFFFLVQLSHHTRSLVRYRVADREAWRGKNGGNKSLGIPFVSPKH
jgi:hypothetical protein